MITPEKNSREVVYGFADEDVTLTGKLTDNTLSPESLSGTVTVEVYRGTSQQISATATKDDADAGEVSYTITAGTLDAGTYSYYFIDASGDVYPWEGAKRILKMQSK